MSSIRSLAWLDCSQCGRTLHTAGVCPCGRPNNTSGQAPIPRPKPYGYSTMKPSQYYAALEASAAKRRARRARIELQQRGVSPKC